MKPTVRGSIAAVIASLAIAAPALATSGELDTSFSGDGVATPQIGEDGPRNVFIRKHGKVLVAARGNCGPNGAGYDFVAVRLLRDGSLDDSFSSNGIFCHDAGAYIYDRFQGAAVQPDGKLVMVGQRDKARRASHELVEVMRLRKDGHLDRTFSSDGRKLVAFGDRHLERAFETANAVIVKPSGKIIIAGTAIRFRTPLGWLMQLHSDGRVDRSFGRDGLRKTRLLPLLMQQTENGKLVIAGGWNVGFGVERLLASGRPDAAFSSDGLAHVRVGETGVGGPFGIALDDAGGILVTGMGEYGGEAFATVRFKRNGDSDRTFGERGRVITHLGTVDPSDCCELPDAWGNGIAVARNGKITVAGGVRLYEGTYEETIGVVRYLSDGQVDSTFGSGGSVLAPFRGSDYYYPIGVAVQPRSGRIVVAGSGGNPDLPVMRLLG